MNVRESFRALVIVIRNAFLGGNIISLSQLHRPRKMLYYIGECLFLYMSMFGRRHLKQKSVSKILSSRQVEQIQIGNLSGGTWLFSNPSFAADLVNLCLVCRIVHPQIIFEIGTQTGYTALHFALNSPENAHIYTLDLPDDQPAYPRLKTTLSDSSELRKTAAVKHMCFDETEWARKITCLRGDSATFDFTPYYSRVDLFFIDGAHSYEYVRSDTTHALRCCHAGSVIMWHDYARVGLGGVSRWLHEFARQGHDIYCVPGGSIAYMRV